MLATYGASATGVETVNTKLESVYTKIDLYEVDEKSRKKYEAKHKSQRKMTGLAAFFRKKGYV